MNVIQETKLCNDSRRYSLRVAFVLGLTVAGLVCGSTLGHADEIAPSSHQSVEPRVPVPDDWPTPWG